MGRYFVHVPILLGAAIAIYGCGQAGSTVPNSSPVATSSTAHSTKAAPTVDSHPHQPPVEIMLGFIKYEDAVAGLKIGDSARFIGKVAEDSDGQKVIVHIAFRYKDGDIEVGPKPIAITATELSQAFAGNREDALKKYVVPLESDEGKYIVEGTITDLDDSSYKVIVK